MSDTPLLDQRFAPPAIERDARLSRALQTNVGEDRPFPRGNTDYVSESGDLNFAGNLSRTVFEVWPQNPGSKGPALTAPNPGVQAATLRQESEAHRAARLRVLVLSRNWAKSQMSPEDEARLVLLTERLRALMPPVTESQLDAIEAANATAVSASALEEEIRARFGV